MRPGCHCYLREDHLVLGGTSCRLPVCHPHAQPDREPPQRPAPSWKRRLQKPKSCLRMFFDPGSHAKHRRGRNTVGVGRSGGGILASVNQTGRATAALRAAGRGVGISVQRIERWTNEIKTAAEAIEADALPTALRGAIRDPSSRNTPRTKACAQRDHSKPAAQKSACAMAPTSVLCCTSRTSKETARR